eukprot:gene18940-6295_t
MSSYDAREFVAEGSTKFVNCQALVDTLSEQVQDIKPGENHTDEHISEISQLLTNASLQREEWSQYVHFMHSSYTRNLVGFDKKFTALLLCWNNAQTSPIHDHAGSSCWVKVLDGVLEEKKYKPTSQ